MLKLGETGKRHMGTQCTIFATLIVNRQLFQNKGAFSNFSTDSSLTFRKPSL